MPDFLYFYTFTPILLSDGIPIFLLSAWCWVAALSAQQPFVLKGNVSGIPESAVLALQIREGASRKEIAATRYKDKLTVIGISSDKNREDWQEALEKHALPWINLHDPGIS